MTPLQWAGIAAVVITCGIFAAIVILKRRNSTPDCVPDCEGKCGGVDDGCGGKCLGCPKGTQCTGTTCGTRPPCVPDCKNKCGEVWDGCIKRGVKGKCPKDCGPNQICNVVNKSCFTNPKDPKKAGCTKDSDCNEFASEGLTYCNKLTTPSSCVSRTKCDASNPCPDPNIPFCSPSGDCVNDRCESMLGKGKWINISGKCFPKCSNDSIGRTNTGWCMETDPEKCPAGWALKEVVSNSKGPGNKVVSKACIPVTDKPFKWDATDDNGNDIYKELPQCAEDNPEHREEGWCIYNEDNGCSGGYIMQTSTSESMGKSCLVCKQHYIDYCKPVPVI